MAKRWAQLATLLPLLFGRCCCQRSIYSGQGFVTYYDIEQPEAFSTSLSLMSSKPSKCGLSANAIDSNNTVAMNLTQLSSGITLFCGKEVIISVNDNVSDLPLFVGEGCERCAAGSTSSDIWNPAAAPGLDLNYSVLNELADGAACAGHIQITWEIRDVLLYGFNSDIAKSQQGLTSSSPLEPTPAISSLCSEGSWRCGHDNDVLEQCLYQSRMPRATCVADYICQGNATRYCIHS